MSGEKANEGKEAAPPPLPSQISAARLRAGLTLAQLAVATGAPPGPAAAVTASRWERNRDPSLATLRAIARATGTRFTIGGE